MAKNTTNSTTVDNETANNLIDGIKLVANQYAPKVDTNKAIESFGLKPAELEYREVEIFNVSEIGTGKDRYVVVEGRDGTTKKSLPMFLSLDHYERFVKPLLPLGNYPNKYVLIQGSQVIAGVHGYFKDNTVTPFASTGFNLLKVVIETQGKESLDIRNLKLKSKQISFDIEEYFGVPYDRTNEEHREMYVIFAKRG